VNPAKSRQQKTIRRISFRRCGAASLLLIIVTIPLALVLTTSLQIVRRQADEARLIRAMRAQLQVSLANYDQELFRQFGLFGVDTSKLQTTVYRELVPRSFAQQPMQLKQSQSIFTPDILARQIARNMKIRLPMLWLKNLADTIKKETPVKPVSSSGEIFSNSGDQASVTASSTSNSATIDPLTSTGLSAVIPSLDTAAELLDGPLKPLLDLLQLKTQLSDLMASIDEVGDLRADYRGPGGSAGLFYEITDVLDAVSQGTDSVLLRQVELAEYCIAYLTRSVTASQDNGRSIPLETLSGLKMNDLAADRPAEVEQVLTGDSTPETATRQVQLLIIAVRCLINLTDILTDQARMDGYRVQAIAVSTAISMASGATINIDPQLFACLLAVGYAIHAGQLDYQALASGLSVALFPERLFKYPLKLSYQDYLRLFLLIVPQDVLISRIGNQIHAAMASDYAHEVSMTVNASSAPSFGRAGSGKPIRLNLAYDA
jgi:hypothetical protein